MNERQLTAAGDLRIAWEPAVDAGVRPWIPLNEHAPADSVRAALITVRSRAGGAGEAPQGRPLFTFGSLAAHRRGEDEILLHGTACEGRVELGEMQARLVFDPGAGQETLLERRYALTASAALLLGRLGAALLHSAALVRPGGRAVLLSGDGRSGKSTTTASLIGAGWGYLSDDQVVLRPSGRADAPVEVHSWLRAFHLDTAWNEGGAPTGLREDVPAATLDGGAHHQMAPLGEIVLPRVEADLPTRLEPAHAADALAELVRQSPWLIADPAAAPAVWGLLTAAAGHPVRRLRLGSDTFRRGGELVRVLGGG